MDHAFYSSNLQDLKYYIENKFNIIYYGNEFCDHLLPNEEQLFSMLEFSSLHNNKFVLLTPPLRDDSLTKLSKLIKLLPQKTEVVFNDFGLLEVINECNLTPVHGRLLCKIKKDPRINPLTNTIAYFQSHNIQKYYQNFLLANKVNRIELDNVLQGYDLELDSKILSSLYYPFVQCSLTFKCIYANQYNKRARVISHCQCQCQDKIIKLKTYDDFEIFIAENAQFYINEKMPNLKKEWNVDRLVYMPKLPGNSN